MTMDESKNPDPQIPGFEWTDDMAEISGFHDGYERVCRTLISQGCRWWSEHPTAEPKVGEFKNVFGLAMTDNTEAKELEAAMTRGQDDITGAMVHAAFRHIFTWHQLGSWAKYQEESRKHHREHPEEDSE